MQSDTDGFLDGYRVVRRLGVGARSEVWLGRSVALGDDAGHDKTTAVALKVYRPEVATSSIDREIEVLGAPMHSHVVQLIDIASGPSGLPILVLERLGQESLAALLAHRPVFGAGEVVTILAPVLAAVGAVHATAVAHGAISPARVLFRPTGAPVLCGFGHAERLSGTSLAALADSPPVARDRGALLRLASGLLGRVDGDDAQKLTSWLRERAHDGWKDTLFEELEGRLFDLADAAPVRFDRDALDEPESAIPLRVHRAEPIEPLSEAPSEPASRRPGDLLQGLRNLGLVDLVRERKLPPVLRKRPVVLAIGLAVVLTIVIVAVPTGGVEPAPSGPPSAVTPVATMSAVSADDPVAALAALLHLRSECIRELSVLCLDDVDQSGSAALDDDVAFIREVEAGEVSGQLATVDPGSIVIRERLGDAALLEFMRPPNSEPASTLLVKGEAGWRIRDYLEG